MKTYKNTYHITQPSHPLSAPEGNENMCSKNDLHMNVPSSFAVVSFMVAMTETPSRIGLRKKALI